MAVKEVALASSDFGEGRAQQGDIILIRKPKSGIGLKEGKEFIWLIINEDDLPEASDLRGTRSKYKYNINLADLKTKYDTLDIAKAVDREVWYQEFMGTDESTGIHTRNNIPTKVLSDIITNKEAI